MDQIGDYQLLRVLADLPETPEQQKGTEYLGSEYLGSRVVGKITVQIGASQLHRVLAEQPETPVQLMEEWNLYTEWGSSSCQRCWLPAKDTLTAYNCTLSLC